jgi:hypothetical protein
MFPMTQNMRHHKQLKLRNETGGSAGLASLVESLHCKLNIGNITAVLL